MKSPIPQSPLKLSARRKVLFPDSPEKPRFASIENDPDDVRRNLKFAHNEASQKLGAVALKEKNVADEQRVISAPVGQKKKKGPKHSKKHAAALPLRRTLIRSSSKKCWETMSPMIGYRRWRKMQFSMNWRMILLLRGVAKMSLLRLTDPNIELQGKDIIEIADGDPNPDADVKFMSDGSHRVAPDSILHSYSSTITDAEDRTNSQARKQAWCLLLGCPGHISIGLLWPQNGKRKPRIEHFDSRGINESIQAGGGSFLSLPHMKAFFEKEHGIAASRFKSVNAVDFQEVELDVYCQTWIFYFAYMRLVQRHSAAKICLCIDAMGETQKLDEIKRFQHWLLETLEIDGFAPGFPEPATVEDCCQLCIDETQRRSFRLPYKAPPRELRRLALSPFSANLAMQEAAASKGKPAGKCTESLTFLWTLPVLSF